MVVLGLLVLGLVARRMVLAKAVLAVRVSQGSPVGRVGLGHRREVVWPGRGRVLVRPVFGGRSVVLGSVGVGSASCSPKLVTAVVPRLRSAIAVVLGLRLVRAVAPGL
ncbi:hypothetical protein ADK67_46040 [Saccharothrix sp. NRRL B-16348]|nr:hypothetical protein ADK67_46040 [Saccharothrix sp. NRRL B-16348]